MSKVTLFGVICSSTCATITRVARLCVTTLTSTVASLSETHLSTCLIDNSITLGAEPARMTSDADTDFLSRSSAKSSCFVCPMRFLTYPHNYTPTRYPSSLLQYVVCGDMWRLRHLASGLPSARNQLITPRLHAWLALSEPLPISLYTSLHDEPSTAVSRAKEIDYISALCAHSE